MKWLIALRVFDPDSTLSLSNVLFMVIIVRVAVANNLDWSVLSGLLLVLVNHNSRKMFAKARVEKVIADQDKLLALTNEVKSLSNALSFKNLGR